MLHHAELLRDGDRQLFRPAPIGSPRIIRDLKGLPPVLARLGPLELRLATTKREIRKAQRLRFRVFYEEGGAIPGYMNSVSRRDKCPFDRLCDHLIVVDTAARDIWRPARMRVVGTYRLLRDDIADRNGGFYSRSEFEVDALLDRHPAKRFLEVGRSCVRADYRSKHVIELLWRGLAIYAAHHGVDVMIGCASLPGIDADKLAIPLSFAYHFAASADDWQVEAAPGRRVAMDRLPKPLIDRRRGLSTLPPLMKAYVRAGGTFASEAVVDHQFRTVDLFTVLPLASADRRYLAHFGGAVAPRLTPTLCN